MYYDKILREAGSWQKTWWLNARWYFERCHHFSQGGGSLPSARTKTSLSLGRLQVPDDLALSLPLVIVWKLFTLQFKCIFQELFLGSRKRYLCPIFLKSDRPSPKSSGQGRLYSPLVSRAPTFLLTVNVSIPVYCASTHHPDQNLYGICDQKMCP